ncbi:MAG TPA: serine/threonine-protein kinase, partial [Rhodocyclaceae bacterium]|nr:serine/threonine-protein kinase [Rhodocyclaceae bacterium]
MKSFFEPGDEIDGFRILERLRFGGTAILYRAKAVAEAGGELLLKVPRLAPGEDPMSVVCHEVEQTMLSALAGARVPRLIAAGDLERQPYLAMEFIDGPSLQDWVERAPLAADEIAALLLPVADAVHGLHGRQVVHLDLKPSNILYRRQDGAREAVLIDLGLAHHAHFPDLLAAAFHKPLGSAPYLAPEQVLGVRCDPRSDIFALGVIMYQLATGRLPFGSPNSVGGLRQRLYRLPPPPRRLAPSVPEWLQEIVLRCLEVDAGDRYATAAQLAFDLAHPDQVAVGPRGRRLRLQGRGSRWRRWLRSLGFEPAPCPPPSERIAAAPIVLVAIATLYQDAAQDTALREVVKRVAAQAAGFRIAAVSVIPPDPTLGSSRPDESGGRVHIRHLAALRHWAEPLGLAADRLTCHVLQDDDAAAALLAYARQN